MKLMETADFPVDYGGNLSSSKLLQYARIIVYTIRVCD